MKKYHIKKSLFLLLSGTLLGMTSCVGDLDTEPLDKDELVSNVVFKNDINAYTQSLAKIYAGMVIGGNKGGDAEQDVKGIDGGSQASFIRVLWNMQELASDMAHCAWNDPGIPGSTTFLGIRQAHGSRVRIIDWLTKSTWPTLFYVRPPMTN